MSDSTLDPRTASATTGYSVLEIERLVRAALHSALGPLHGAPAPALLAPWSRGVDPSASPGDARIAEVDRAVRSVLAELRREPTPALPRAEVFADQLLSLRHVERLAAGTREVRIAPGTVVTPLAR